MKRIKIKKPKHHCNLENAKRIGRCHYICPICKTDLSMLVLLSEELIKPGTIDDAFNNKDDKQVILK